MKMNIEVTRLEEFELMNCPFCDHEEQMCVNRTFTTNYVVCKNCGASGPEATTEELAIKYWNQARRLHA